jgi:hypothetical protein
MQERILILNLAREVCRRRLEKADERVSSKSAKLFEMSDSNSTVRRRAVMRASLSTDCEERDRWEKRIEEIDKWLEAVKNE